MKKIVVLAVIFLSAYSVSFAQSENLFASYYHSKFNGRKTATGATYWDYLKTAASNVYKLGTKLLVTNLKTGKSVIVVVNDRMAPKIKNRVDLSKSAFEEIASTSHGIVPVSVRPFGATESNNKM